MLLFTVLIGCFSLCKGLSLQGDGFLSEDRQRYVKECVENTIKGIMREDETVLVAHYGIHDHLLPTGLPHPVMMMNVLQQNNLQDQLRKSSIYPQNFVIFLEDTPKTGYNFHEFVYYIFNVNLRIPTAKYVVVLANAKEHLTYMYSTTAFLKYLTVISYSQYEMKLYRFAFQGCHDNGEGIFGTKFVSYPIYNLPLTDYDNAKFDNCKLILYGLADLNPNVNSKLNVITEFVISQIVRHLGMKLRNAEHFYMSYFNFGVGPMFIKTCNDTRCTGMYYEDDMIFTVPAPKSIPRIEFFKFIFKIEMWICTCTAFVLTSFVWWMLHKFQKGENRTELSLAVLKIFSITIWGFLDKVPLGRPLRIVFTLYVFYAIHIQTAFTSNLVELMTVLRYEPKIANLEQLANSNLTILLDPLATDIFPLDNETSPAILKIYSKIKSFQNDPQTVNLQESSYYMCICKILPLVYKYNKTIHYFKDNSIGGKNRYSFKLTYVPIFQEKFQDLITRFVEHGLILMNIREFEAKYKKYDNYHNVLDFGDGLPVVLTTSHVFVIFIIWGVGIAISTLVFVGEIAVSNWKSRTRRCCCIPCTK